LPVEIIFNYSCDRSIRLLYIQRQNNAARENVLHAY